MGVIAVDDTVTRDARWSKRQRTALIVSPHFPPSTLAGVHRARHLAKHLPAHGWRPIIIRVDEAHYTERPDTALASLVPASIDQVRTGAFPSGWSRLVGIGDIGLRGYVPIKRAIAEAVRQHQPSAILITGSPYYPMLLSGWIKRRLEVPVVLDFQDPWVSNEGTRWSRWTKPGIVHQLAVTLEPMAVRHAAFVTSVSDLQNAEMAVRYPWLDASRMAAIPIGGDPDDFSALRANPPSRRQVCLDPALINLSYVGTFLPRAGPLVRALFQAVRRLKRAHPALAARMHLNFVGTSNQPDHIDAYRILPIADEEGVSDLVSETPQRVPFLEALHILANSQGLLLIGSDEPHYTASKIYPALMSGRPFLSLFHTQSSAHEVLSSAGGGLAFAFDSTAALPGLVAALADGLVRLGEAPSTLGRADPCGYARYIAYAVAGQFADVFDTVAVSRGAGVSALAITQAGPRS